MTIHHDKLAYGRLKRLNDEMSADEIARLVEELNEEGEDAENLENAENKDNKDNENPPEK